MKTIHADPGFVLEADITCNRDVWSLDLYQTFPCATHPRRTRKTQLNLPAESLRALAWEIIDETS